MARLLGASFFVFLTLLALFFGVGLVVLSRFELSMPLGFALSAGFAIFVVILQFCIGPALIDWIVDTRWVHPQELGLDFASWLDVTCRTFRIPTPRFGIIEETAPNAFTYGHGAYDARVVVTRGLINALSPEELKAVVAHELGHIKHRDFIVMTAIQALVLAMYALYRATSRERGGWYTVVVSYLAYWVSYYASLYLSRVREYMADYASAQITQRPNDLAVALVKIAYGLAQTGTVGQQPTPSRFPSSTPAPRPTSSYPAASQPVPVARAAGRRAAPARIQSIRLDDPSTWPNPPALGARPAPVPSAPMPHAPLQTSPPAPANKTKGGFKVAQLGAFGVMGAVSMRGAVAWTGPTGLASPDHFVQAARWEIFNPWAKVAEVMSTHPLTALRIRALQKLNPLFGQPNAYDFSKIRPGRYQGFWPDLLVYALPMLLMFAGGVLSWAIHLARPGWPTSTAGAIFALMGLVLGGLIQLAFKYPGEFSPSQVFRLLGELDVSPIRCKPIALEGHFTGRLDAGIAWSSDYVFQDATGFISCLYLQPLAIMKLGFGLYFAQTYVGRPVRVYGWYRRFNAPYVEISHFTMLDTGETIRPRYVLGATLLGLFFLAVLSAFLWVILRELH